MPHDIKGQLLEKGDTVTVRATVSEIHQGEEFCNLNLLTVEKMYPGDNRTTIVVNGKQVEKEVEPLLDGSQENILQYFAYSHLPEHLQAVSKPFGLQAQRLVDTLPRNPERTVALRKLLESKDAAVRAALTK